MAEPIQFNKKIIDALPSPAIGTRHYYEDPRLPALRLSVTDQGAKSWVVQRRINGQVKRITLGRYPALTPENARKRCEQVCGDIAQGIDPQSEKLKERTQQVKLEEAFEEMLRVRTLRPKTQWVYRQIMNAALKDWQAKPISSITGQMVADRHAKLAKNSGGAYADSAMRTFRSIWNFAQGRYDAEGEDAVLTFNPVKRLSKTKAWARPKRRETYIREHELPAWLAAVEKLRSDEWDTMGKRVGDYLLLTLLTGLRRSESAGLLWTHVDLQGQTLTVPDTKNYSDHVLPLSSQLTQLLVAREANNTGSPYVFPGEDDAKPLHEPRYQMRRVIDQSGTSFTMHDLRRTFATIAESLDLSHYALKRLLNHRITGDVTAGYIGRNIERLRDPMQRISDFVYERLPSSKPALNSDHVKA